MNSSQHFLREANRRFKENDFEQALYYYKQFAAHYPEQRQIIKSNVALTLRRLGKSVNIHALLQDTEAEQFSEWIQAQTHLSTNGTVHQSTITARSASPKAYKTIEEAFDSRYYANENPDLAHIAIPLIEHYKNWGWKEGRKPNQWFDPRLYKELYRDVADPAIEPLNHYIKIGQHENRITCRVTFPRIRKEDACKIPTVTTASEYSIPVPFTNHNKPDIFIKVIAFFLPQFHPFPENDLWWGKGFTEWTNVTKAKPVFDGHYQPHLPIHNGFYDLRLPEVLAEQAQLARNYGIYGFNFYYYWFNGKILMHRPFENLMNNANIDINFCLTWANENWTRRWDGNDNEILIGQSHSLEDSRNLLLHLIQYFNDSRYIKIDGKPVLIIYRPGIIPNMLETVRMWRLTIKEYGFNGIYLIGAQTFGFTNPEEYEFDAVMQFPPHTAVADQVNSEFNIINRNFSGKIYNYKEVVRNAVAEPDYPYKKLLTAMLSWDNTARKQDSSHIFADFDLSYYKKWISAISFKTLNNANLMPDEKIIFINAWNEWAEGTHLEPDRKFGYGYLEATYDAIKVFEVDDASKSPICTAKASEYAIIVHIHYRETWDEISNLLKKCSADLNYDLFVTVNENSFDLRDIIRRDFPQAIIRVVENRGRDILPFLTVLEEIKSLQYKAICKIHGKKSLYRRDGDRIRGELLEALLCNNKLITDILGDPSTGICCPSKYLIEHTEKNMTYDREIVDSICSFIGIEFEACSFPAGSMYWIKPEIVMPLLAIPREAFEVEEGLADGTLAHGIERVIVLLALKCGLSIYRL